MLGGSWRGEVTAWGDVEPWDGGGTFGWHVAADDRWHSPSSERTLRQVFVEGTPVVETRLRIPSGDAVQRVWAVADHGGLTVMEVENDSPLPIAVAFTRADVLTSRPPAAVPVEGIDLPAHTVLLPIGHRSRVRVALTHGAPLTRLPDDIAAPDEVVRGWQLMVERAGRLVLPDPELTETVVAARCALMLRGVDDADDVEFLLGVGEMVRLGDAAEPLVPDVVTVAERVLRHARRGTGASSRQVGALWAAAAVLADAGETRGVDDIIASVRRLDPADRTDNDDETGPDGPASTIAHIEAMLDSFEPDGSCAVMPGGFPAAWLGQPIEAHGLRAGPRHRLSFAIRWHGERPALLWQADGPAGLRLTGGGADPAWSSSEPSGDALLAPPAATNAAPAASTSFS